MIGTLGDIYPNSIQYRSCSRVTLPAHPEYITIAALQNATYLKATGDERRALTRIRRAWGTQTRPPRACCGP